MCHDVLVYSHQLDIQIEFNNGNSTLNLTHTISRHTTIGSLYVISM